MLFCNTGLCSSVPRQKIPLLFSVPAYISEIPFPWTKRLLWNRHTVVLLSAYIFQILPDHFNAIQIKILILDHIQSCRTHFCQLSVIFTGLISGHILKELQSCFFMIRIFYSVHTARLRYWSPSRQIPEMVPYGSYLFHTRLHSEKYSTHRYT